MKKLLAVVLLLCAVCALSVRAEAAKKDSIDDLLRSRAAVVWIGGKQIGDLMVGASAKLYFQFIDNKLANASSKCNLVILIYKTMDPWIFDPAKITVNGEPLDKKRVYSSLLAIPTGKIASDVGAAIAFGVPKSACRPGETLVFGYDQYKAELVVPGKK